MTEIKIRLQRLERKQQKQTGVAIIAPAEAGVVLQIGNKRRQFETVEDAERAYTENESPGSALIIIDV